MAYRTTRQSYQSVFPVDASADPNFRADVWVIPGDPDLALPDLTLIVEAWHASYRRAVAFQYAKMVYLRGGQVMTVHRGRLVRHKAGDVFFIRRGESMGLMPADDERFRMVTLDLPDSLLAAVASRLERPVDQFTREFSAIEAVIDQGAQLRAITAKLMSVERADQVAEILAQFFGEILSETSERIERSPWRSAELHPVTADILTLIEDKCPPRINLRKLEDQFGYSRGHIISIFKNDLRTTPQQYLLTYKVGVAAERLTRGGSLPDIIDQLNFADQSHLTRAFQTYLGVSPMRFASQLTRRS